MGIFKDNLKEAKKGFAGAKERYHAELERQKEKAGIQQYICPLCNNIMQEPMLRAFGMLRQRIVKCEGCGLEIPLEKAKQELSHSTT